nr:secreted RxLR effector protein 161-like [Nicotiana tomentosiformis]
MIGALLYLTASRPDIVFSVGLCARFQANSKESHLKAVKRILRYIKGTPDLCLWYPRRYKFDLVGYVDADYVGFHVDRKSTSGTTHFLGSCLVSWGTKKQHSVALSIAEAVYGSGILLCSVTMDKITAKGLCFIAEMNKELLRSWFFDSASSIDVAPLDTIPPMTEKSPVEKFTVKDHTGDLGKEVDTTVV